MSCRCRQHGHEPPSSNTQSEVLIRHMYYICSELPHNHVHVYIKRKECHTPNSRDWLPPAGGQAGELGGGGARKESEVIGNVLVLRVDDGAVGIYCIVI